MSVANRYDLASTYAKLMTDPEGAVTDLHTLAEKLADEVAAIDKATTPATDGEKVNPLEAKYAKDEAGRQSAESFLHDAVFGSIVEYIDEDPGRTYHVLNAVSDMLVRYLRSECEFFKRELTPKAAKVSRKGEFKADYNALLDLIRNLAGVAASTGWDASSCNLLMTDSAGKFKSVLPGFRGTKSVDDGTVTGRYAKVYSLAWSIDGEEIEDGWTIPDIVRMIWHGSDRISKNAKSLTDILDKQASDWTKPDFTSAEFTVNGHACVVSRVVTED